MGDFKSGGDVPAPDPKIGEAALKSAQIGEQWLQFSKDQFAVSQTRQAEIDGLTKRLTEQQLGIGDQAIADSNKARERYETKFLPIEDEFIAEASNYGTPERQDAAAAEAGADVQIAAARARGTAAREATAMGIDPNSGRFAAVRQAGETGTALAAAGAANNARTTVRDKGLAMKEAVVNLGKGLPAAATASAAFGINAGNSAAGLNAQANQQFMGTTGIMGQGFQGGMSGYGQQAGILGNQYDMQMRGYEAKQAESAALWGGIGTAAGAILGGASKPWIFSDENLKEDKADIPDGEALQAVKAMPVETWKYQPGIGDGEHHVGTYAQDFAQQTGSGDGHTIDLGDAIGVTMKAVQDLDAKVDKIAAMWGIGPKPANDVARKPRKRATANDNATLEAVEA